MNGLTLCGAVLVSLGIPLGMQGYSTQNLILGAIAGVLLLLGVIGIYLDLSNKEHILKKILKVDV